MPTAFCIPKEIANKLKEAAKRGAFNISEMMEMDSTARRELFEKFVDKNMAKEINGGFEKAMVSNQATALTKWAESTFTPKEKLTPRYRDVLAKIAELKEGGVINPNNANDFLEDMVATKLGAYVTPKEVAKLTEFADRLQVLAKDVGKDGNPTLPYFIEHNKAQEYIGSLTPANRGMVLVHTVGRGNMLTRTSSATFNVIANTVKTAFNRAEFMIAETLDSLTEGEMPLLRGDNPELVREAVKMDVERFVKSGYSLSRSETLATAQQVLGEDKIHSQGKGAIRATARAYDKWVFGMSQGLYDIIGAAAVNSMSTNMLATKWAQEQGFKGAERKAKAAEVFWDAHNLEPKTDIGQEIRAEAIKLALDATNTQNSIYTKFVLGVRRTFDNLIPKIKPGTALVAFAKTPANATGFGIESAGVAAVNGFMDFAMGKTKNNRKAWKEAVRKISRSGLGWAGALMLINYLVDDDSVEGEYSSDPKVRALREAKNVAPNSFTFLTPWGKKNIRSDYLGGVGTILLALKSAEKEEGLYKVGQYAYGVATSLSTLPGMAEYNNIYEAFDASGITAASPFEEKLDGLGKFLTNFLISRAVPGLIQDVAKATDPYQRKAAEGDVLGQIATYLPKLRESQPIKKTFAGDALKNEDLLTIMLFGARVKTVTKNKIVEEYQRLEKKGMAPGIPNLDKPRGDLQELKAQIGDKEYIKAKDFFRESFVKVTNQIMDSDGYQNTALENKKKLLDKATEIARKQTLVEFNFTPPPVTLTPDN